MKKLFFYSALAITSVFFAKPTEAAQRICYFSFNNQSEVETTQAFVNQLNRVSPEKIEVKEFLTEGSNPEKAFLAMVESGQQCDGLVISGHHTGAHGGKRAAGKLDLEFIEKLSCDPRYKEWFRNINALWLEGCRTVGVGTITPQTENKEGFSVDYHVKRVSLERQADGLTQTVANLDHEFSNTLDQDNPLDSRYLRSFPKAKVFGWTNSAPGEKSDSERSLLFHMAHIAKYMDPELDLPESPLKENISPKGLQDYLEAINLSLMPFNYEERACEDLAVQGWIDHGTHHPEKNPLYAFANPDLKAFSSVDNAENLNPLQIKALECMIKNALNSGDDAALLVAVDEINSDPKNYRYTLGTMLSVYQELKAKKPKTAAIMFNRMRNNPQLASFLEKKMNSKQVGFVRRLDYYSIYKELTGYTNLQFEYAMQDQFLNESRIDLPRHDKFLRSNTSAVRTTQLQALLKNNIGGEEFFDFVLITDPEWDILLNLAKGVSRLGLSREEQVQKLVSILHSPRADPVVWKVARAELVKLKLTERQINSIYNSLNLIPEFIFEEQAQNLDWDYYTFPPGEPIQLNPPPVEYVPKKKKKGLFDFLKPKESKKRKSKKDSNNNSNINPDFSGNGGIY